MRVDIKTNYLEESEIKSAIADELANLSQQVEAKAKTECPVKTGALKSDIGYEVDRELLEAKIGNNLDYSVFVLLGAKGKPPNNYLLKGLNI